ncbi:MAG: hypothetical protein ACOYMA_21380 [Bacteroidia bacterium]
MKSFVQFLIIPFFVLLFGCNNSPILEKKPYSIELLNVGLPDNIDTNNLKKIGADLYIRFDQNSDSVLVKVGSYFLPSEDGLFHFGTGSKYYKLKITNEQKTKIEYISNYFLSKNDGTISKKRQAHNVGCNLLGTWAAIYTDSIGTKHFYNFEMNGLPKQLESTCQDFYFKASSNELPSNFQIVDKLNTDSIMNYLLLQKSMKDIPILR